MSRWLQSAASLLETLDDAAGRAIVEQRQRQRAGAGDPDAEDARLDTILATRGLGEEQGEDGDIRDNDGVVDDDKDGGIQETGHQEVPSELGVRDAWGDDGIDISSRSGIPDEGLIGNKQVLPEASTVAPQHAFKADRETERHAPESCLLRPELPPTDPDTPRHDLETDTALRLHATGLTTTLSPFESSLRLEEKQQVVETGSGLVPLGSPGRTASGSHQPSVADRQHLQQAQKEAKKLKRHVLALHQQLETSEQEVEAQRRELESVGVLMEKERAKFKAERESLVEQYQTDLKLIQQRHREQMEELQSQIEGLHRQRAQEGGNWSKELEEALEREQQTLRQVALLQDEKETLQQHIDTLESQQQALGSRLESLTETADAASVRERQAERRLDELLTVHARQIQQRQLREAELEKTIGELGAALVKAQEIHGSDDITPLHTSSTDMMVESIRAEMEMIQTQLSQEQQRNKILQDELRSLSTQQSDEVTVLQLRKEQHDRQLQELSETILHLKKELRDRENVGSARLNGDGERAKQINDLSEEVFRLREKVSSLSSETSTLRSRLHVALDRAKRAEQALEENVTSVGAFHNIDLESGSNRRRLNGSKGHPTIRAALRLDVINGEKTERLAKTLDSLDAFLIQSGRFLRYNAVARLLFILYFILIHLWTSILLFVHVHGYEAIHSDYGIGVHGPGGLMPLQTGQITQKMAGG